MSWATGLPWRVMTTFSPSSTARMSSGSRFLAWAMLTSMPTIIAIHYGYSNIVPRSLTPRLSRPFSAIHHRSCRPAKPPLRATSPPSKA